MIFHWENPWFFLFLGGVFLLLVIYLLKSRGSCFYTQALFLWEGDHSEEKSSSSIVFRKLPLSFYLEAAAFILLVCGGAALFVLRNDRLPPAVVLLNNSYSMTPETRAAGAEMLKGFLKRCSGRQVIWALCGSEPEILSKSGTSFEFTKGWNGEETVFSPGRAIAWGKENFPDAEIIVVTDRVPEALRRPDVTLISCGRAGENIAITSALIREGRVVLEITGFSDRHHEVLLRSSSKILERFTLAPGEKKLFNFRAAAAAEFLTFQIETPADSLEYDNKVFLINRPPRAVTYSFGTLSKEEKNSLEQVLKNNPEFRYVRENYELLFTRSGSKMKEGAFHRVLFHHGTKSVLDREPPFFMPREKLLSGLSNTSLLWAYAPQLQLRGRELIAGSSAFLLSLESRAFRYFDLHFNLDLKYSNLPKLPFWPAFFCNLAELCLKRRDGIADPHGKAGEPIRFSSRSGAEKLSCRGGGTVQEFPLDRGMCLLQLKRCGFYTLKEGGNQYDLAVNPRVTECSDLRNNKSVFVESSAVRQNQSRTKFAGAFFIGAALLLLALNQFFLSRKRRNHG